MRALALVLLTGCAASSPRVTTYPAIRPNLRVVELPVREVDRACRRPNQKTDSGLPYPTYYWPNSMPSIHGEQPAPPPERVLIPGCYERATNTIYVDEFGRMSLLKHELCHASGKSASDCAGVD